MNKNNSLQRKEAGSSRGAAGPAGPAQADHPVQNSPVQRARRQRMQEAFGPAAQLQEPEPQANRTGMPDSLKAGIESMSGMDMSDVRVHRNSPQPKQINALAYAQGNDIHLGPGQEQHMPHEAWHLVQQRQGRVRATTDVGGTPVNDDVGLEKEADTMGAKAAAGTAHGAAAQDDGCTAAAVPQRRPVVAQAIMSVADFRSATYGVGKRRTSIGPVDVALSTYIGARTAVNAFGLRQAADTYLAGAGHAAGRVAAVTTLRARATEEHQLLHHIGDANAHLVDGLLQQAAGTVPALLQLASTVTAAQANHLPALILAIGGAANIAALNAQQLVQHITPAHMVVLLQLLPAVGGFAQLAALDGLVQAAGAAHAPLLPSMIAQSGGQAQLANLTAIVNRHAGQGHLAFDLTREAAGNAATFQRLAGEVPLFLRTGPPGALPGEPAAIAAYNAALSTRLGNLLAPVIAQATAMLGHANALCGGPPAPGAPLHGARTALNARIVALAARAAPLIAGGARVANDLAWMNAIGNLVGQLSGQLPGVFAGIAAPTFAQNLANVAYPNTVVLATAAINAATGIYNTPIIGNSEVDHFLQRHTAHYFDFADIKPANTLWPPAWGAGTAGQVGAQYVFVLNALAAAQNWMQPLAQIHNNPVPMAGGATALIAARAGAAAGQITVGQFYPENNPGVGLHPHPDSTMRAIFRVL